MKEAKPPQPTLSPCRAFNARSIEGSEAPYAFDLTAPIYVCDQGNHRPARDLHFDNHMKQLHFRKLNKAPDTFGGALIKPGTHPKTARPLDSRMPTHLVLKAKRAVMRVPKYFKRVDDLTQNVARTHGVRIYEYANAGDHLHLLLKIPNRVAWKRFIRNLTSQIRRLTGVRWAHRPFTRVVRGWRKAFRVVRNYIRLNAWEAHHDLSKAGAAALRKLRPKFDFSKFDFVYA